MLGEVSHCQVTNTFVRMSFIGKQALEKGEEVEKETGLDTRLSESGPRKAAQT